MEIERTNMQPTRPISGVDAISAQRAQRAAAANDASSELTIASDTIEISDRARELARAQQAADAAPDVRSEKVAQIKTRVEDGTYSVPSELLAQKLLDGWSNGR